MQDGVCLLVANLTVVTGFFFKLFGGGGSTDADDSSHENTQAIHQTFMRGSEKRRAQDTFELSTVASGIGYPKQGIAVHVERMHDGSYISETWSQHDGQSKTIKLDGLEYQSDLEMGREEK
jgi:hypothetical protein